MVIILKIDGHKKRILLADYIKAKTASLKGFGYSDLTEAEVERQARLVLDGGKLNVIGMFMENEIEATP